MTRLLFGRDMLDKERRQKQTSRKEMLSDRKQTEFTDYSLPLMSPGEVIPLIAV